MSLQTTTATEHSLTFIRKRFAEEYDDLSIFFILHDPSNRREALALKRLEIIQHPAGKDLYEHLTENLDSFSQKSCFGAMARALVHKKLTFTKKDQFIAVIFLNKLDFIDSHNPSLAMRYSAYFHSWEVLTLRDRCIGSVLSRQPSTTISRPLIGTELLRKQMLADCFASMLMESGGEKNLINSMLLKRTNMCLSPIIDHQPEDFPLPLTLDAIHLVYKDLHEDIPPRTGPIAHTKFMTNEISDIYDDLSLTQWVGFARSVQEMAWTGYNKNEILSAAIYACENPHVRSMAYILAEILDISPTPLKSHNYYNPFDEFEANERAHFRAGKDTFEHALEKTIDTDNPDFLWKAAAHSNSLLTEGTPIGWCAQALQDAYAAYCDSGTADHSPSEAARQAFDKSFEALDWKEILRLHRTLIKARRAGLMVTPEYVHDIIYGDEILSKHITAFDKT